MRSFVIAVIFLAVATFTLANVAQASCTTSMVVGGYNIVVAGVNGYGETFSALGSVILNANGTASTNLSFNARGYGVYAMTYTGTWTMISPSTCLLAVDVTTELGVARLHGVVGFGGSSILFSDVTNGDLQMAGIAMR